MNRIFALSVSAAILLLALPAASASGLEDQRGRICDEGDEGLVSYCIDYGFASRAVYAPLPSSSGTQKFCVTPSTCLTYNGVTLAPEYVASAPAPESAGYVQVNNCFKGNPCRVDYDTGDVQRILDAIIVSTIAQPEIDLLA